MTESTTEIDSFIIRFVHSHPQETSAHIRGSIRHIQSNEEKAFAHWHEVEQFIKRFIPHAPFIASQNLSEET